MYTMFSTYEVGGREWRGEGVWKLNGTGMAKGVFGGGDMGGVRGWCVSWEG